MLKHVLRKIGVRLCGRLLGYHALLAAGLLLGTMYIPGFAQYLPVGGVQDLVAGEAPVVASIEQPASIKPAGSLLEATHAFDRLGYARQLMIVLVGTWLLMLPIAWVHKAVHRANLYDHSLNETVLILPGTVAAIVLVVQHSLALAFSLAGIVAGVQFRRALQDTFDALFILVAIGAGITAGVRALEITAVLTIFFSYATLYVYYFGYGYESDFLAFQKERKKWRKRAIKSGAEE
jgi:hypothetical protein